MHNAKSILEMANMNFGDFKFSNDEIMFIIVTSSDLDFFPHQLISISSFRDWFIKNFAGESTEELDFLEEIEEIWKTVSSYITKILETYDTLKQDQKEDIFKPRWWEKLRFIDIATRLKDKLSLPGVKDQLRQLFKKQKDKISYYDFFSFILDQGIKLRNWQEDTLQDRLDQMGLAFIEFNEFNEFCANYGIDFKEPLIENDLEAQLEAKLNLSYKDYQLSNSDYF